MSLAVMSRAPQALTSLPDSLSSRVAGPFGCPWLTFAAIISVAVAAVVSVVWAVLVRFDKDD